MSEGVLSSGGLDRAGIERLAEIIMILQRCFMLRLSEQLSHGQVSFPQYFLLGHIDEKEGLSMTEIAERMSHTTAAATGLVDRLENLGYVSRTHGANDRRKVLVRITPKGRKLVHEIRDNMATNLTALQERLTPEEQVTWLTIYEKIYDYCRNTNS